MKNQSTRPSSKLFLHRAQSQNNLPLCNQPFTHSYVTGGGGHAVDDLFLTIVWPIHQDHMKLVNDLHDFVSELCKLNFQGEHPLISSYRNSIRTNYNILFRSCEIFIQHAVNPVYISEDTFDKLMQVTQFSLDPNYDPQSNWHKKYWLVSVEKGAFYRSPINMHLNINLQNKIDLDFAGVPVHITIEKNYPGSSPVKLQVVGLDFKSRKKIEITGKHELQTHNHNLPT